MNFSPMTQGDIIPDVTDLIRWTMDDAALLHSRSGANPYGAIVPPQYCSSADEASFTDGYIPDNICAFMDIGPVIDLGHSTLE